MTTATPAARPFTGRHMLALMLAFFGVIIAVNLTMAYFARSSWPGLVVANGYVASQEFARGQARTRRQAALGWSATVAHRGDTLTVRFSAASGPIAGMKVQGALRRPATESQDQAVSLRESGAGTYIATVSLGTGQWQLALEAEDARGQAFSGDFRITVKE